MGFVAFKNPCERRLATLKASACLIWFLTPRKQQDKGIAQHPRGVTACSSQPPGPQSRHVSYGFRQLRHSEASTTRTGGGLAECWCFTMNVKLDLDILIPFTLWTKWLALPLTLFFFYFPLLHGGLVTQRYLCAPNSFPSYDISIRPGLVPFPNCFKVWVGAFTHSLKQYMWKSKQLIFVPKYCYTHCSSFQRCTKKATRYALVWQLAAGCVSAERVIC